MRSVLAPAMCLGLFALAACSSGGDGTADSVADSIAGDDGTVAVPPTPAITAPPASVPDSMVLTDESEMPTPPAVTRSPDEGRLGDRLVDATDPIDIVFHPVTGEGYVAERLGTVRVIRDGALTDPVLDLTASLTPELEWGLLGLAFAADGDHVYLNETDGFETRIHEFAVGADGGFDAGSGRVVYRFDQPAEGHNGGDLLIGPEGNLFIFNGDGGGDRNDEEIGGAWNSDIYRLAQSLDSPLGKILRIDPTPSAGAEFTVPPDNPFVDVEGALGEIWATGVRNPWRNGFDPLTGDLWVADVGNFEWEEISRAVADDDGTGAARGVSFGWSAWEGFHRANDDQDPGGHLVPVHEYAHGEFGCSIVGGPVYRGTQYEGLDGHYLFGDHCTGDVRAMQLSDDGSTVSIRTLASVPFLVDIVVTPDDRILVTSIVEGIHELVP